MKKIEVICNTSPLIGLLAIDRLYLLCNIFERVLIPQAVYEELCAKTSTHQDDIHTIKDYVQKGKLTLYQVENQKMVEAMYGRLHYGELEVIVGAKEKGISLAIIDDLAARKIANELMIDTIGVIGLLCIAKTEGMIESVRKDLDKLRTGGYYISDGLYHEALRKAKEI